MWIEPWSREDWVSSRKDFFYLRCSFWAQLLCWFIACPAFLFVTGLALLGRPMGGIGLTTIMFLGLAGAVSVSGSQALHSAMGTFYLRSPNSELSRHKFWVEQSVSNLGLLSALLPDFAFGSHSFHRRVVQL
jgi:ABC-type nickel/cobalt efflux system permease component RcnA